MQENKKIYDVIIVGAGASGITAGRELSQFNQQYENNSEISPISFKILEAQDRIGGRLHTLENAVDLGASWLHQWNHNINPLPKIIKKMNFPLQNESSKELYFDLETKQIISQELIEKAEAQMDTFEEISEEKAKLQDQDISFQESIQEEYDLIFNDKNVDEIYKRLLIQFIDQYKNHEGATFEEYSAKMGLGSETQEGEDNSSKDFDDKLPIGGYQNLFKKIAEDNQLDIQVNNVVKSIIQDQNTKIYEITNNIKQANSEIVKEEKIFCKYVILSCSINILRKQEIDIQPKFSEKKMKSLNSLKLGQVNKLIMEFKNCFWDEQLSAISIASNDSGKYPIFYNMKQTTKRNILVVILSDSFGLTSESIPTDDHVNECVKRLKTVFKEYNKKLEDSDFEVINAWQTKWNSNPYTQGSYTFYGVGSSNKDCEELSTPENNIYLIGEACNARFLGTTNAAVYTGYIAAQKIIEQSKNIKYDSLK